MKNLLLAIAATALASGAIAQTGGAAGAGTAAGAAGTTTGAAGTTTNGTTNGNTNAIGGALNGTANAPSTDPQMSGANSYGSSQDAHSIGNTGQAMKNSKRSARAKKYHDPAEKAAPSGPSTMPSNTAPKNN